MESKRKIIVAVTGASGAVYAEALLERLEGLQGRIQEVALVFTENAKDIWGFELGLDEDTRYKSQVEAQRRPRLNEVNAGDTSGQGSNFAKASSDKAGGPDAPCGRSGSPLRSDMGQGKDTRYKAQDTSGLIKEYDNKDFYAPFASGSSRYDTMIICPASMGMLGRIAAGVADDLITRAADVMLKERRRLIMVPRETPYNLIHINNMKLLTEAGAIILPATPSFYSKPKNIRELVLTVVDRVVDLAGFEADGYRWGEEK